MEGHSPQIEAKRLVLLEIRMIKSSVESNLINSNLNPMERDIAGAPSHSQPSKCFRMVILSNRMMKIYESSVTTRKKMHSVESHVQVERTTYGENSQKDSFTLLSTVQDIV